MKTVIYLIGIFFLVLSIISCEKDEDKKPGCNVTKTRITDGGADTAVLTYTYNADGKLTNSDMGEGYYFSYTWSGNQLTAKYYDGATLQYTDVYSLDSEGNATSSTYANAGSSVSKNTTYEYSDGYLIAKTVEPTNTSSPVDEYTYEYENGNLVDEYHDQSNGGSFSSHTTYEYYTDKVNNYSTSVNIYGKSSANLVKKKTYTTTSPASISIVTNYSYQFGSDGKIVKITATIGSNPIYTLPEYSCNN